MGSKGFIVAAAQQPGAPSTASTPAPAPEPTPAPAPTPTAPAPAPTPVPEPTVGKLAYTRDTRKKTLTISVAAKGTYVLKYTAADGKVSMATVIIP